MDYFRFAFVILIFIFIILIRTYMSFTGDILGYVEEENS